MDEKTPFYIPWEFSEDVIAQFKPVLPKDFDVTFPSPTVPTTFTTKSPFDDPQDGYKGWLTACEDKGHIIAKHEDGSVDQYFLADSAHVGPGCVNCGWHACWYCDDIKNIPECPA